MSKVKVKITSAVVVDGAIIEPGNTVEVTKPAAENLLHRGKAEEISKSSAAGKKAAE